ncbi:MAG TPA: glycosyltransferase [Parafilimonas sp.]|nr:glycosyltransferase [Parafilimonas sp.]
MKVLWLASWYPDEYQPTNGDFVQRHAKAVSELMPVDVIHVAQAGRKFNSLNKIVKNQNGNLHEFIHYFTYKKSSINWLDKILYNKAYWRYYKEVIDEYIVQKGKPDLIHVHVPFKAGIIALDFSRKNKIPFIVSEHSSLYLKEARDNYYTRDVYFRFYTKQSFKKAAAVTNVSASIAKVLEQMFQLKKVHVIPNVVDTNHFYFKPKQKNKLFRWLHVSTMYPLKNVDKIIQAFSNISKQRDDWELIFVGPINNEYVQLVEQLNLQSKIKFIGEVTYEDVAQQMQQADAFIMFSKHENFPCVIIEALCCGLPVVASNVGGTAEAINNSNGILVEANNIDQLQNAIISMMRNINNYNSKQIAAEASLKYSYEVVAAQFTSLYKEVLK